MREGYIKLWRSIWDNPRIRRNHAYLAVWLWILTHAEHGMVREGSKWRRAREGELRRVKFDGGLVSLGPGQVTCGSEQISSETGVPSQTVRRYLKVMRDEQQIEQRTSNRCSLITVKNWDEYQMYEQLIEQQMGGERAADEQPVSTIKEDKEDKKVDNPTGVPQSGRLRRTQKQPSKPKGKKAHLEALAVFTVCAKPKLDNREQLSAWIARNIRASNRLAGFSPRQIATAYAYAVYERDEFAKKNGRGYDISLETVEKKIFEHKDDDPGGPYEENIRKIVAFYEQKKDRILSNTSPFLA